ncbi:hypothetical protein [Sphingobacterium sp.]|uniref:hypothetical protein n=1 Tax=Sphingobacterium sp. TaxID=341027 RepID=UPI0028AAF27A|nr:hypothetical protein [Sphingobacterium sp.]
MENFWTPVACAFATVIGNVAFLAYVKNDLDKKLETFKIAYSGIFKEKLEVYKNLLERMDYTKSLVLNYGHSGNNFEVKPVEIMREINVFIKLIEHGSIFYNDSITKIVSEIRIEFQDVFDLSFRRFHLKQSELKDGEFDEYLIKLGQLTSGRNYSELKNQLINTIREEFHIK